MSVVILDGVIVVEIVDVIGTAIDAGGVIEVSLSALHNASLTCPGPNCVWRTDSLCWLNSRTVGDTVLDKPIVHREQNNAVPVHIMNSRVSDGDIGTALALGRS